MFRFRLAEQRSASQAAKSCFLLKGAGATTRSITVGDRTDTQELVRAVSAAGIRPVIDNVFEFGNAATAFNELAESKHFGKLMIRVN